MRIGWSSEDAPHDLVGHLICRKSLPTHGTPAIHASAEARAAMQERVDAAIGKSLSNRCAESAPRAPLLLDLPHFVGCALIPPESETDQVRPRGPPIVVA